MDRIETSDSYHASYLMVNGAQVDGVECIPMAGGVSCKLIFSGPAVLERTEEFFKKEACVNLHAFRQAYNQVQSFIQQARRSYRTSSKQAKKTEV